MGVRAKFKVESTTSTQYRRAKDPSKPYSQENTEIVEMRTISMSPVYHNGDQNHENSKFWNASPSGKIELGTINPEAWSQFELGKEYYVDFAKAEE